MNNLKYILLFLAAIGIAFGSYYIGMKSNFIKKETKESVSVVVEKIEKVFKLVTVEATIAEIYDHKDYYTFDISLFRKKALLRVNAKVAAGYDFEKVIFETDEATKTITLKNFPEPEILSIDHDIDYYDITEGSFNTFTPDDYNRINANAKAYIKGKAVESEVLQKAAAQKNEIMSLIQDLIKASGWSLVIEEQQYNG